MGLFDGFDLKSALPKPGDAMPDINLSSFLPNLSTGGDVFSSFDNAAGVSSIFSGMPSFRNSFTNSFSSAFGGSWNDFLPTFGSGSKTPSFRMPWDAPPTPVYSGGLGQASGPGAALNQYGGFFSQYGSQYGLDPNLLMAIAIVENGTMGQGDQYSGAQGLMQIMPGGYPAGEAMYPNWRTDAGQNIALGAYILSEKIKQFGSVDAGIMGYLGYGGEDAYGTTAQEYLDRVKQEMAALKSSGGYYTGGAGSTFLSMFGGQSYSITSENGVSNGMPASWYDYATGLGLGYGTHPGLDIAAPSGSQMYMPAGMTGTVEIADGLHGYGYDPNGGVAASGAGTGQLRIKLNNGAILIFGHMKNIYFAPGQPISAGQLVGLSGGAGSGSHVHMEYRIKDSSTSTGWRSVDPRQYMG